MPDSRVRFSSGGARKTSVRARPRSKLLQSLLDSTSSSSLFCLNAARWRQAACPSAIANRCKTVWRRGVMSSQRLRSRNQGATSAPKHARAFPKRHSIFSGGRKHFLGRRGVPLDRGATSTLGALASSDAARESCSSKLGRCRKSRGAALWNAADESEMHRLGRFRNRVRESAPGENRKHDPEQAVEEAGPDSWRRQPLTSGTPCRRSASRKECDTRQTLGFCTPNRDACGPRDSLFAATRRRSERIAPDISPAPPGRDANLRCALCCCRLAIETCRWSNSLSATTRRRSERIGANISCLRRGAPPNSCAGDLKFRLISCL
jgi:hypothetical protein